ncbi:MAG: aldo/keto reductase [Gammaproteobacteria bacterium]|nr:aldo/keto reductase [Gammaproteobacteria bacterium]
MKNATGRLGRRQFIQTLTLLGAAAVGLPLAAQGSKSMLMKAIPSSGEKIPVIGMGSSRTFEVGDDQDQRARLAQVLQAFFDQGGTVIDTSPMYGSSELVLGELLANVQNKQSLFMATKVWTEGSQEGIAQMQQSMDLLQTPVIDLMQIHNLLDWKVHWETLAEWKQQGRVRYIGITTHRGYDHDELAHIMQNYPIDFIQFSYSIANRKAEQHILPLAAERGIATMVNRPFQRGDLFRHVKGKELPAWAADLDCNSWGQFFLKFVISHPAVTCTIPATSKVHHMVDNMAAGFGRIPDNNQRKAMLEYFDSR